MKIIDWNEPTSFIDLFKNIRITSDNNGLFKDFKVDWIKKVTVDFGNDDKSIEKNLLNHIKQQVDMLKCYHGTRLVFSRKIKREGLKVLSPHLINKLCKQIGCFPLRSEQKEIQRKYNDFIKLTTDGRRKHIYLNIDKYAHMYTKDNEINTDCSFFYGSEGLCNIVPDRLALSVRQKLRREGCPTVVCVWLPFRKPYLNEDQMRLISIKFFTSWFNFEILKQEQYKCDIGLNIACNIKPRHIKDVFLYPKLDLQQ